ncbi:hypothetical protein NM688_g2892 [Phlebia brevispora]|uniref:Uncharacterized protein n=1 Tax=Phlebia brevispora TaxID=194682 RepID=A0ACC1T7D1_9APHY|nr:hypothetical protein NM688_g2892 [Phlebia brevispora]
MAFATTEEARPYQMAGDGRTKVNAKVVVTGPWKGRSLPQELIDQVVDFLSDDREALKACSLVCQDWLHRCRQHLHRSVTIYHQYCRIHHSQVPHAIRLLALPMVSSYTQELHLEGKTDYGALHKTPDNDEEVDGEELLWRVLARFGNVRTLRVSRLLWVAHELEDKNRLCATFPAVTNLDVYMSEFVDAKEFLSLLTRISPAVTLEGGACLLLPQNSTPGKRLEHLQVQHCDVHNMLDISRWLSETPSSITSLYLSPPDGDDFAALPSYFRALGPSLEKLFLTLEFATKDETLRQAISGLELCSRLRSLTLAANFGLGRKFVKAANFFWPCVMIVLEHVASTSLQTIRFECYAEDLESTALLQLDATLRRPAFTHVSAVQFVLCDYSRTDTLQIEGTLQALLPYTSSHYHVTVSPCCDL